MLKPKALFLGLMAVLVAGFALGGQAIPNWSAPATWTPTRASGVHTLADVTNPIPFVGVTPCRVADTRGNGFSGAYGPPSLVANATRTFVIVGRCSIPASAAAVSFNFGALNVGGAGDLRIFPDGGAVPTVSTLNYNASTPNIANAAIVPLGSTNGITVQADAVSIDLIIDVNGYYPQSGGSNRITSGEFFGIYGTFGGGGVNFGENDSATGGSSGVRGRVTGTGLHAAGLQGEATATGSASGGPKVHGVFGTTNSGANDGAGVLGTSTLDIVPGTNNFGPAGVRGEGYIGVAGATNGTGGFVGVTGAVLSSTGSLGQFGLLGYAGAPNKAVYAVGDFLASGAKSFGEPHPTDATKMIDYVSLEGPEAGTYFRGTARFVNGMAVIPVPDHFAMVTDEEGLTVQLTPVGSAASMYVVSEDLNQIVVRSNRDVKFHYQVNGVRLAFKDHKPIADSIFMPLGPDAKMPDAFAPEQRRRLIANGTYNEDGTVNLETARAAGWAKIWEDNAKAAEASLKARAEARALQTRDRSQ